MNVCACVFVMEPSNATKHSTENLHSFAFLEVENVLLLPLAIYPSVPLWVITHHWFTIDSPENILVHLVRTMDEDDPEISLALRKLPGQD